MCNKQHRKEFHHLVSGECEGGSTAAKEHLEQCTECAEYLSIFMQLKDGVKASSATCDSLPGDFSSRVMERIREETSIIVRAKTILREHGRSILFQSAIQLTCVIALFIAIDHLASSHRYWIGEGQTYSQLRFSNPDWTDFRIVQGVMNCFQQLEGTLGLCITGIAGLLAAGCLLAQKLRLAAVFFFIASVFASSRVAIPQTFGRTPQEQSRVEGQ